MSCAHGGCQVVQACPRPGDGATYMEMSWMFALELVLVLPRKLLALAMSACAFMRPSVSQARR